MNTVPDLPPGPLDDVDPASVARAQGWFNVVSGAWPLISMRSFEAVFGPKKERWLARTVAGLLLVNGCTQLRAPTSDSARTIGVGTAATLLAIDLVYVPRGRIRWTYLIDAAFEAGWLVAWWRSAGRSRRRRAG